MSNYMVILSVKTILNLIPKSGVYRFDFKDFIMFIRQILNEHDKIISPNVNGLIIEISITAKNIEEAIANAIERSEFFMSSLSFETSHVVHYSNVLLAYDITENIEKRVFKQYFYNLPFFAENTQIFPGPFTEHTKKIYYLDNTYKDRVFRAIRWYRKGINANDSIDQFLFFWHGLESLNSPLAEYYGNDKSVEKEIGKSCDYCGKGCKIIVPGGIEALFSDLGHNSLIKEIKDIRNDISHGRKTIAELYESTLDKLPILAEILHQGICYILDIKDEFNSSIFKRVSPIEAGDSLIIEGHMIEKYITKLGLGYHPYIKVETKILDNGIIDYNFENIMECEFNPTSSGISGNNIKIELKDIE